MQSEESGANMDMDGAELDTLEGEARYVPDAVSVPSAPNSGGSTPAAANAYAIGNLSLAPPTNNQPKVSPKVAGVSPSSAAA